MKKTILFTIMFILANICQAQTFIITDITPSANPSQEEINAAKKLIGSEFNLSFSDKDVTMIRKDDKGETHYKLLQNIGNNKYRKYTSKDNNSYDELELNTLLGYIKGGTFIHIHHGSFGYTFKFKRK